MALIGSIAETRGLSSQEVDRMFELMRQYFAGVQRRVFTADLAGKPWVVLLRDPESGVLHGFSTLCLLEAWVAETPVRAFFSGDTIIDRPYWGSLELARVWLQFLFSHIDAAPEYRWYWFLICMGYRTYRYLPAFFHAYHPAPAPTPPFQQQVLNAFAAQRFGDRYDPATGVIRGESTYRLRPGIGDISARELADTRIAFFQERNPGWSRGDELACLTELRRDNLRRMGARMVGEERVP